MTEITRVYPDRDLVRSYMLVIDTRHILHRMENPSHRPVLEHAFTRAQEAIARYHRFRSEATLAPLKKAIATLRVALVTSTPMSAGWLWSGELEDALFSLAEDVAPVRPALRKAAKKVARKVVKKAKRPVRGTKAFTKIAAGLTEALTVARGHKGTSRVKRK